MEMVSEKKSTAARSSELDKDTISRVKSKLFVSKTLDKIDNIITTLS